MNEMLRVPEKGWRGMKAGRAGGVSQRDSERSLDWWLPSEAEGTTSQPRESDVAMCAVFSQGPPERGPQNIFIIMDALVV